MSEDRPTRSLELTTTIRASSEAVWKALTDAEDIVRWYAPEARTEPRLGGTIWLSWGGGMDGNGEFTLWEPPAHLQTTAGKQNGVQLYVDYFLETAGGETKVRLVHSGFSPDAQWDGEFDAYQRGWTIFLANLRHVLERHPNAGCVQIIFSKMSALAKIDVWNLLVGPRGLDRDGAFAATPPKAGDAYQLTMADGTVLEGEVQIFAPARDLALTLKNFDDALLRVSFEGSSGTFLYGVVLAYGLPPEVTAKLRKTFDSLLDVLDAPQPAAAPA